MPQVWDFAHDERGSGHRFAAAMDSASKTARGIQDLQRGEQGLRRGEASIRREEALAGATEMRLEDLKTQRQIEEAQQKAALEFQAWQVNQFMRGGNDAITRASEGITVPGASTADSGMAEDAARLMAEVPPEYAGQAQAYLQERMGAALAERRYEEAVRSIQDGVAEGVLDPEAAQSMLTDLEDAAMSDIGPDQIIRVVREQRNQMADEAAAHQVRELSIQRMGSMITAPTPPPNLSISANEWAGRQASAIRALERYRMHWRDVNPIEAEDEIRGILYSEGLQTEQEQKRAALQMAMKWPQWEFAETPEARAALVEEARAMVAPVEPDGSWQQGASGGVAAPQGPTLAELPALERRKALHMAAKVWAKHGEPSPEMAQEIEEVLTEAGYGGMGLSDEDVEKIRERGTALAGARPNYLEMAKNAEAQGSEGLDAALRRRRGEKQTDRRAGVKPAARRAGNPLRATEPARMGPEE